MIRDYSFYIQDIIESIERINEFINGMTYDDFCKDDKTASAVIRKLEIIGEAVKHIPEEIISASAGIPWKEMARMRDRLIHGYFGKLSPQDCRIYRYN